MINLINLCFLVIFHFEVHLVYLLQLDVEIFFNDFVSEWQKRIQFHLLKEHTIHLLKRVRFNPYFASANVNSDGKQ